MINMKFTKPFLALLIPIYVFIIPNYLPAQDDVTDSTTKEITENLETDITVEQDLSFLESADLWSQEQACLELIHADSTSALQAIQTILSDIEQDSQVQSCAIQTLVELTQRKGDSIKPEEASQSILDFFQNTIRTELRYVALIALLSLQLEGKNTSKGSLLEFYQNFINSSELQLETDSDFYIRDLSQKIVQAQS